MPMVLVPPMVQAWAQVPWAQVAGINREFFGRYKKMGWGVQGGEEKAIDPAQKAYFRETTICSLECN
jgi:hypothetical protein